MARRLHSLHIVNSDIETVENYLSNCQEVNSLVTESDLGSLFGFIQKEFGNDPSFYDEPYDGDDDIEEDEYDEDESEFENNEDLMESLSGLTDALSKINQFMGPMNSNLKKMNPDREKEKVTFYLLQSDNIISVYSDYFESCFNIDDIKSWFKGFANHLFFFDYFDDDFLEINLLKKNKVLSSLILCEEENGMTETSSFKFKHLKSLFPIEKDELKSPCNTVEESLDYYSSLLNIPFHLDVMDVEDNPEVKTISFYI